MKYAVLILVVLLVWWLLRARQRKPRETSASRNTADNAPAAVAIVHCTHCGLHLPRSEAVAWRGGYYCDETHRLAAEQDKER